MPSAALPSTVPAETPCRSSYSSTAVGGLQSTTAGTTVGGSHNVHRDWWAFNEVRKRRRKYPELVQAPKIRASKSWNQWCRVEESLRQVLIRQQLGTHGELIKELLGEDDPLTQVLHDDKMMIDDDDVLVMR